MTIPRITIEQSTLLVVDVQQRLLVKMPDPDGLVRNVAFLIDVAKLLGVPVIATEQYPRGLGPTHPDLARRLPPHLPTKTAFSCCGAAGLLEGLLASRRSIVVLAGMETHVCIMNTALDLRSAGLDVVLPVDALQARGKLDHDMAMRRMELTGSIPATVESVAFEWMGGAEHPQFKAVSRLIQERMSAHAATGD